MISLLTTSQPNKKPEIPVSAFALPHISGFPVNTITYYLYIFYMLYHAGFIMSRENRKNTDKNTTGRTYLAN
jgi:hypothetical protein